MKIPKKYRKIFNIKTFMTAFIVFMMLGSVFGFVMMDATRNDNSLEYNGYKIKRLSQTYQLNYDGNKLDFFSNPQTLESFEIDKNIMDTIVDSKALIVVFNPNIERTDVMDLLRFSFYEKFDLKNKMVGFGVTDKNYLYDKMPVVDCQNSSVEYPVLIFDDTENNEIKFNETNGCIKINSRDLMHRIKFHDKVLYTALGVMK